MVNYFVYDTETFLVLRKGSCSASLFEFQAQPGEIVCEGEPPTDTTHYEDGVHYTPAPIPKTLEEHRLEKVADIKSIFQSKFSEGYTTQGLTSNFKIDCGRDDKENLESLLQRMRRLNIATTTIKDYNNEFHSDIWVTDLELIINELIDYGLWLYQHKWEKEEEIAAATTKEEIAAIQW